MIKSVGNGSAFSLCKWMPIAEREIGVKEHAGNADHPRVVLYHTFTSLGAQHDEVPWCSSFVCFVMSSAGFSSTESALARSWLDYGNEVTPQYGAIMVLRRGRYDWQGHVAFYVYQDASFYYCLGGNQSDSVNVSAFLKTDLLAARWPKPEGRLKILPFRRAT